MHNKRKGLIHLAMTTVIAASVIQCAWAGFGSKTDLLALDEGYPSVYSSGTNANIYSGDDDDESYVVDVNSPEAVSIPSTTKLTGNIQISGVSNKVTLSLRDADVKQVLRMFADKANMNVVFHSSTRGEVTLDLKDVPIEQALEYVLNACELVSIRQGNSIVVASKKAIKDLGYTRQNFSVIPVKYVNAQNVANFLNKSMFNGKYQGISSAPVVSVNPARNELLLLGSDDDEVFVKKILTKIDVKPMMNTYTVNHITPLEMASTICDTILSDKSEGNASNGVALNTDSRGSNGDDEVTLSGGYVACVAGESSGALKKFDKTNDLVEFTSNPLMVAFFPNNGTIALYGGSREQVKVIESFIKLHDKKQPMAYIELSLVQLSEDGSKAFETQWKAWTPFGVYRFDKSGVSQDPTYGETFFKGNGYATVDSEGNIISRHFKNHGWGPIVMSLNYLIDNGKGRVLASPKVMVTNGKKSIIDLTSDYLQSIKQEFDTGSTSLVAQTTYNIGSDQGIKVEITPFISPDGYISMNLKPDYSTIKTSVPEYTLLTRRSLELENIRVKDGETLVLAGLIQETETQGVKKVPVLGDLPLVGPFFRMSNSHSAKEELVIMVTPHIVYSKEQVENLKASENL